MKSLKEIFAGNSGIGRQGIWYVFAGGSAALLELLLFTVLNHALALDIVPSNVIATVIATIYNFLVNRTKTFQGTSNIVRSAILYVLLFVANTTISSASISFFVGLGVPSVVAKACMQVCVTLWNFVLYKKVVFR